MKKILYLILVLSLMTTAGEQLTRAQGPLGRDFGFGLNLGEPLGGTVKLWLNKENALQAHIGGSYFSSLRIGADYLWHFDVFRSQVVKMYAGPGAAFGFGNHYSGWYYNKKGNKEYWYYRDDGSVFGIRAIFGLNVIPKRSPIEIFMELGPFIGISPTFGSTLDAAIGIRFYP
jgi:hypothetical protein